MFGKHRAVKQKLEDIDPNGFKTRAAGRAKKAAGIKPFAIPQTQPSVGRHGFRHVGRNGGQKRRKKAQ